MTTKGRDMYAVDKGDRVRFISSSDPHTRLTEGTEGTVTSVREPFDELTIGVAWDDGSSLSMIPDAGDRIELVRS